MHLFRKYINNRGSALFMVISTMTALMVSCMAMYFSVVSSRSTQYAVFYQNQSKQVSTSINDSVIAGMMDNQLESLTNAMTKLNEGEKLSAGANGFEALGALSGVDPDADLGAYTMEITRLPNETVGGVEKMVFDIATTAIVNGASTVYHTIIYYEEGGKDSPPAPTQVFAATGYVPNDVFLDGGRFITDVFFDNEMTIVNAYGGKNMELWGNLSTGGSLLSHSYLIPSTDRTQTFAIRNKYTADFNGSVDFSATATEKSLVLIGGDAIIKQQGGFNNAYVYTLGNWYAFGNGMDSSIHFVDGNVYLHTDISGKASNFYTNGKIYLVEDGSSVDNLKIVGEATPAGKWDSGIKTVNSKYLTVSEMITTLEEKTATNQYYKWVINDSNPKGDKYVKELNEKSTDCVKKSLHFTQGYRDWMGESINDYVPTIELRYSDTEKGCIIEDITCDVKNTRKNYITLIIDTGENEDNVYTIRVKNNQDLDGDKEGKPDTFSWYPFTYNSTSTFMNVLVKGRGSVVIDVPPEVTYQDMSFLKVMHYNWFLLGGGIIDTSDGTEDKATYNEEKGYWESRVVYSQGNLDKGVDGKKPDLNYDRFIHTNCKAGDGCDYTEKDSVNTCTSCGGTMKSVKCSIHGNLNEFCPTCQPDKKNKHAGECVNHVGRSEIDDYLAKPENATLKTRMTGKDGKIIYPTTNIFLVSCDESANIRLSLREYGEEWDKNIMQNSFFGYIYAPYMTFKAYGNNSGGNLVRLMGGMTVSDYIIDDSMSMIACWPEKMPTELMSDECRQNKLDSLGGRGWKISLKAH